jgi:hypothetical protein
MQGALKSRARAGKWWSLDNSATPRRTRIIIFPNSQQLLCIYFGSSVGGMKYIRAAVA